MKKHEFKRILLAFDEIERNDISFSNLKSSILLHFKERDYSIDEETLQIAIDYMTSLKMYRTNKYCLDLNPAITIYAKSNPNSILEVVSLCESMMPDPAFITWISHQFDSEYFHLLPEISQALLNQTILFDDLSMKTKLFHFIKYVYNQTLKPHYLLSTLTYVLFTDQIVRHKNFELEFKNEDKEIHDYDELALILKLLPRKGIPHSRDETKSLQSFYKDTLFNEFDHCCPICGNHIAFMLIASHIKPFRDCAHIYEAIDHNNGLLLCRNHDFLFDQGYFTFDDNGKILISSSIKADEHSIYQLNQDYYLPKKLFSKDRKAFLAYHRKNIFQK